MKLGQLILFTREVEKLARFYRDVLGLAELDNEPGWSVLDAGGVKLALHGIPVAIAGEVSDPPSKRESSHLPPTFLVDDLDATLTRLRSEGTAMSTTTTFGPRTFSDGMAPDGNVFQIAQHA